MENLPNDKEKLNSLFKLLENDRIKNNEELRNLILGIFITKQVEEKVENSLKENLMFPFVKSKFSPYSMENLMKNG